MGAGTTEGEMPKGQRSFIIGALIVFTFMVCICIVIAVGNARKETSSKVDSLIDKMHIVSSGVTFSQERP